MIDTDAVVRGVVTATAPGIDRGNHPVCPDCQRRSRSRSRSRSSSSSEEREAEWQELKMYHGTSWERACEIESGGFQISDGGRLGAGVYVARYEKARQFALAFDRHKQR